MTIVFRGPKARPNATVNLGLIGCGFRGQQLIGSWLSLPGVRITAVCDVHEGRMEQARQRAGGQKVLAYRDYRKLLASRDVDAVIVTSNDHWHLLHAVHACQAGKDVYVEKPLCTSIREGRTVVEAATKYGRVVQFGTWQRSMEHYRKAVEIVRSGRLGQISQVKVWDYDNYVTKAIAHLKNLLPEFERRGLYLCLENHGGLRMRHFRRVLKTFPSEHLGLNLDTGNPLLTLEDPVEVVRELAPRTYTCHLKDWNLLRSEDGLIVRGCALGDGVVDLKAVVEALRARAPQEYIPLKLFTAEFWRTHGEVTGRELERILRLLEKRNAPARTEDRIASMSIWRVCGGCQDGSFTASVGWLPPN